MSPFADAAVAASLSHQFKIPWVADLRDPWALDEFQVYRTRWHRRRERCRMRKALESASLIIMNTPEAASCLRSALSALNSIPVISLPNGYDEDDFAETLTPRHNPKFTVVHTGAMHTDVGLRQQRRRYEFDLLGRLQPGVELLSRSHYFLVKALESWIAEQPALVDQLEVVFAGVPTAEDQAVTDQSRISRIFRFTGYLPHAESVQRLRTADLLFLPLHKVSPSRRASIVPGKTYEYMASGRPILAAVPDGDAKDFLNAAGTAQISEPDDVEKIREILEIQYRRWASNRTETSWNQTFVKQFERRRLTEQLAEQLRALVG